MRYLYKVLLVFLIPLGVTGQTIVDIVVGSEDHTVLEAAVLAAGLETTLSGDGPFTLFAPTDAAFAALPDGTVDALLADPEALTAVLTYHAIAGRLDSPDLSDGLIVTTVNGKDIEINIGSNGVFINQEANITVTDIQATNGVVHVINAVLIPPTTTVVDVVVNSDDHNTLEAAVLAAGLETTLSGEGPFTLFAPTDAAFAALPDGTVDALLGDIPALTEVLLYHAVAASVPSSDLVDSQTAVTVNGKNIYVSVSANGVFINNTQVTIADIETDNGVVHVIDTVLLPPSGSVVDVVVNSEDHNILEAAVLAAGLETTLTGDGPFTLFAPTDAAFEALPPGTVDALLGDIPALTDILTYHVVASPVLSTSLADGLSAVTVNGKNIEVSINPDGVFINEAQVTVSDIITENGIVHVIDAVLLPPRITVVDVVVNSPEHTILETAVGLAGLGGVLSEDGPFTLFAPTDAAFEALPEGLLQSLIDDPSGALVSVLTYHVIAGEILSTDLVDGQSATTINGDNIVVSITAEGVLINDALVTMADIVTDNGVVHVIDAVLVPATSVNDSEFGEVKIFPNPVSEMFQLDVERLDGQPTNIELYSVDGSLVRQWRNVANSEFFDISELQSGLYILRLASENYSYTKRIIKN
jgi:uncharacterized surface protein with fasciclin (FAS1) repeats